MPILDHKAALGSQVKSALDSQQTFAASGGPFDAVMGDPSNGGSVGVFMWAVWAYLMEFVKQGIDTPEERQRVKAAVLAAFDAYLSPRLGTAFAAGVRKSLDNFVTNMLESLGG